MFGERITQPKVDSEWRSEEDSHSLGAGDKVLRNKGPDVEMKALRVVILLSSKKS